MDNPIEVVLSIVDVWLFSDDIDKEIMKISPDNKNKEVNIMLPK
jgi:hypothetical protein